MRISHISTHITVAIICVAVSASLGTSLGSPIVHAAGAGQLPGGVSLAQSANCYGNSDGYRLTLVLQAEKLDLTSAGWHRNDLKAIKAIALLIFRGAACSESPTQHEIKKHTD